MKNNNIEFEPASNFNSNNIDLPMYYSADGEEVDDVDSPDGNEESVESESEEEEVGGVDSADLPKYRQLVKQKKIELRDTYGKGRLKGETFTKRECKTIKVPESYTDRVCNNVNYPCPTWNSPLKSCTKQVCVNVPKVRMIDKEVCVNIPYVRMKWISGWRKKWREFKRNGGLQQLRLQSQGIVPIVPETPTPTPTPTPTTTPTPINQRAKFLLRGTSRSLKNDIVDNKAVVKDSEEVKKTNLTNDESSKEAEKKSESKEAESKEAELETSDKILGMPKMVAIGVGIAILAIGGFVVYKKFIK